MKLIKMLLLNKSMIMKQTKTYINNILKNLFLKLLLFMKIINTKKVHHNHWELMLLLSWKSRLSFKKPKTKIMSLNKISIMKMKKRNLLLKKKNKSIKINNPNRKSKARTFNLYNSKTKPLSHNLTTHQLKVQKQQWITRE